MNLFYASALDRYSCLSVALKVKAALGVVFLRLVFIGAPKEIKLLNSKTSIERVLETPGVPAMRKC